MPPPKPAPSPATTTVPSVPLTPLHPVESARITLPEGVLSAFGSIWVTGHHSRTAFRLDPSTGAVIARIPGIGSYAQWPFAGGGLVWVPSATSLTAIDPGTNSIVRTFPGQYGAGAFASGHPWVDDTRDSLEELDPKTGVPLVRVRSASGFPEDCFNQVRLGDGSLWWSIQDAGLVVRVDPGSGHVVATISGVGQNPSEAAFAAGSAWVSSVDGSVREIDPMKNRVSTVTTYTFPLSGTCEDPVVAQGDTVWVGHGSESEVFGFDGRTRTVTRHFDLGFGNLQGLAVDGRSLWVPFYDVGRVQRFDPPQGSG